MELPQLVAPTVEVHASFLDALAEFQPEGHYVELDADVLREPAGFARYVSWLHELERPAVAAALGWVAGTTRWYVEDGAYFGTVSIRHRLTPALEAVGGHIGYEVRPSARRRGFATRMLALALPIANALGIDPALVTCDPTNAASRKVIEANGGEPAERIGEELRYRVPTGPR